MWRHPPSRFCAFFTCTILPALLSSVPTPAPQPLHFAPWTEKFASSQGCLNPPVPRELPAAPAADEELLSLLKAASSHGIVTFGIFFVKEGDPAHTRQFGVDSAGGSWLRRMACIGVRMLVLAGSRDVAKEYAELGALPYYSEDYLKKAKRLVGGEYDQTNMMRWLMAETIISAGFDALYVDMDVLWFKDPRLEISKMGYDILGQPENTNSLDGNPADPTWTAEEVETAWLQVLESSHREAKKHEESVCCQGGINAVNLGIVFVRATDEARRIAAEARARTLNGPCENMMAALWALYERCEPRGGAKCGMLPSKIALSFPAFKGSLPDDVRADDGGECGIPGRPCSWDIINNEGPHLLHLDVDDKTGPTKTLDLMWPPCLDPQGMELAGDLTDKQSEQDANHAEL